MGLSCCRSRKICGKRISNWKFQIARQRKSQEKGGGRRQRYEIRKGQNTEKDNPKNTRRQQREGWGTRKIQSRFGIQRMGHPPLATVIDVVAHITPPVRISNRCIVI